jgi:DNA repair exonuclease SbcCD ATPase subunit
MAQQPNLTPVKRQVTTISNQAADLMIDSQESLSVATDILSKIKASAKDVKNRKEEITKPLNDALKSARSLFKPIEDDLATAERTIKDKMLDYSNEVEAAARKQAEKLEDRVERGTMRTDTAMRKMDEIETVGSQVQGAKGSVQFRTVRNIKVVDPTKIPLKYLMNEKVIAAISAAVRTDVLNGTKVEGVEIVEERQVAAK